MDANYGLYKTTVGGREFTFRTNNKSTILIREEFKKPFNQLLEEVDQMGADEIARLLWATLGDRAVMTQSDFVEHVLTNTGIVELYEVFEEIMGQIQYPGLAADEIEKKQRANVNKQRKLQGLPPLED